VGAFDNDIQRFRSRIFGVLSLRYALMGLTGWAVAWGTASLALRACRWASPTQLLWGLAGILPCLIAAVRIASRSVPPDPQIAAALDRNNAAGGLMMAGLETDIGQWRSRVPAGADLQCRWQGRNWWLALAAAATFAVAMLLLPDRMLATPTPHVLDVNREVERLTTQIETLERERIIPPDQAETLQEKLDRLRSEASGEDPVKTWESLDHVEKVVLNTAAEAAEELAAQKDKLTSAQVLAEALATKASKGQADDKTLTKAMKSLAEMTRRAGAENQAVRDQMKESLSKACRDGQLSQEQLDELSDALKEGSPDGQSGRGCELSTEQLDELSKALGQAGEEMSRTLDELAEAGMIEGMPQEGPPSQGAEGQGAEGQGGEGQGGLMDFIEGNQGGGSIEELVEAWRRTGPGRGAVDRGRGDAAMTWSKGTDADGAKFKPQALSPAAVAALKESKLTGVSLGRPTEATKRSDDGSGALSGAAAGGGSAHTHVILPRHRGTVRRYFDRGKEKN